MLLLPLKGKHRKCRRNVSQSHYVLLSARKDPTNYYIYISQRFYQCSFEYCMSEKLWLCLPYMTIRMTRAYMCTNRSFNYVRIHIHYVIAANMELPHESKNRAVLCKLSSKGLTVVLYQAAIFPSKPR